MANLSRLPPALEVVYEWQHAGACTEADPDQFFSPSSERGITRAARESVAKAYCRRCPVVRECLDHAVRAREPFGIWGGLNAEERRYRTLRLAPTDDEGAR